MKIMIFAIVIAACAVDRLTDSGTGAQSVAARTDPTPTWQTNCDPDAPPGDPDGCGGSPGGGGGDSCGSCTTTIGCIRSCGGDYACVDVGGGSKQCVFSTPQIAEPGQ